MSLLFPRGYKVKKGEEEITKDKDGAIISTIVYTLTKTISKDEIVKEKERLDDVIAKAEEEKLKFTDTK